MLRFEYESFLMCLVLLPILIIVWRVYQKDKEQKLRGFASLQNLQQIVYGHFRMNSKKWMASIMAIGFLVLGIANLQKGSYALSTTQVKGGDILIVLDVSKSMAATDVSPSRMMLSKLFLKQMIEESQRDRIGLLSFAGTAELDMPLTSDHISLLNILDTKSAGSAAVQGTAIADALRMGLEAFDDEDGKQKTVLLVTDGEDHESGLNAVLGDYSNAGVRIMSIGVGSSEGAEIVDPRTQKPLLDDDGEIVVSKYDPKLLRKISDKTGGYMGELASIRSARAEAKYVLSATERKLYDTSNFKERASMHWIFLVLAAISLLLGMFDIRSGSARTLCLLCFLLPSSLASAQNTPKEDEINAAQIGTELYREEKYAEAREAFAQAIKQKDNLEEQAQLQHNIGNTYAMEKNWKQAIDAYKESLRINPRDENTRYNLAYAQKQDKKNDQDDQQNQNNQQNQQNQDQQQQQNQDQQNQQKQDQQQNRDQQNQNQQNDQKQGQQQNQDQKKQNDPSQQNQRAKARPREMSEQEAEAMLKALREKEKKLHEGDPNRSQKSRSKSW